MAKATFDLTDWDAYRRDMERLGQHVPDIMQIAGHRAGAYFDGVVRSELPPPVRTQHQAAYWTDKQRRWWWATMRAKALGRSRALPGWKAVYKKVDGVKTLVISGGYRRTGKLVQSLAYEVRQSGDSTVVLYGTNRLYATYVLDETNQATYHKGNWKPLQAFADEHEDQVRAVFYRTANDEIDRLLGV